MRLILFLALTLAAPAVAQGSSETADPAPAIRMIDAKGLSVADLMAMAAAERRQPTALSCCDWGGGCIVHPQQSLPDS